MELQHNGKVNIAVGLSADSARWKNEYIEWSQLVDRLTTVVKTTETLSTYLKASREEQSKIKDIGGFVGGYINGGKRKVTNILYRQLLTLDIDFGHKDLWLDFTVLFNNAAVLHATHKSSPANPRYRLVMPLSREVSQEEYLAISRKVASMIGIECFDASTFQVNRLMFWPSCPCDVEFYSEVQDGEWLDADEILSMYINWHDVSEWPMTDTESDVISLEAKKQEDPTAKKGVVGAFCRAYDIHEVIAEYLSDVYTSAGDGRYTYIKGTTAAGLIVQSQRISEGCLHPDLPGKRHSSGYIGNRTTDQRDGQSEFPLFYADPAGPEGPDEHVFRAGGSGALLRLPDRGVSVRHSLGNEGLPWAGKGTAAQGGGGLAAGGGAVPEEESLSQNL